MNAGRAALLAIAVAALAWSGAGHASAQQTGTVGSSPPPGSQVQYSQPVQPTPVATTLSAATTTVTLNVPGGTSACVFNVGSGFTGSVAFFANGTIALAVNPFGGGAAVTSTTSSFLGWSNCAGLTSVSAIASFTGGTSAAVSIQPSYGVAIAAGGSAAAPDIVQSNYTVANNPSNPSAAFSFVNGNNCTPPDGIVITGGENIGSQPATPTGFTAAGTPQAGNSGFTFAYYRIPCTGSSADAFSIATQGNNSNLGLRIYEVRGCSSIYGYASSFGSIPTVAPVPPITVTAPSIIFATADVGTSVNSPGNGAILPEGFTGTPNSSPAGGRGFITATRVVTQTTAAAQYFGIFLFATGANNDASLVFGCK